MTVPQVPATEEGDSPAEIAVLYSVIFGSIVVVCIVLLSVILGLKYVQGEHRDMDKGMHEGGGEEWRVERSA